MFKMIVFDMDGTLTPSKGKIDNEMAELLKKLLKKYKVAIISGGKYELFQKQVLPYLGDDETLLSNLYVCPTCSTAMYLYKNGNWHKEYSLDFTQKEKDYINDALDKTINYFGLKSGSDERGEMVEDRKSQITIACLGQYAPLEEKLKYDPNQEKRKKIKDYILSNLKGFNVSIGGTTSIDIIREGIDKAYGTKKLMEISGFNINELLFIGDLIFPGGNDYPVLEMGVTSKRVFKIEDTKKYIKELIK